MRDYALIAGCDEDSTELYVSLAEAEGMEAIVAQETDETSRIVAERGRPRLFIVDLGMSREGGFAALLRLCSTLAPADRPPVLALVAPELVTTAGDLTEALGINEMLPRSSGAQVVGAAIRRTLARDVSGRYPIVPTGTEAAPLRRLQRK
jgi:DNA-binding response OmpR family regulator